MTDCKKFATFYLDGLFFGIEVHQVQEVIRCREMTRVPLAPATVCGLLNLRGQIVTAIDLRRRLELPPRAAGQPVMNVVVRTEDCAASLLVDEVGDVIEPPDDLHVRTPATFTGAMRELVRGVYTLSGRLLLVLDTERALTNPAETCGTRECAAQPG